MALSAKAGNFTCNTTTGNQSITGVGFQPKIVLFLPTAGTADGVAAHAHASFGVGISSSERFAVTANSENGQSGADAASEISTTLCILINDPGVVTSAGNGIEADFVSLDADGFTVNITANAGANAFRVGYLALGGSDLTNVKASEFLANNSTGNQAVTGVGFQPDAIMVFSNDTTGNTRVDWIWGSGFAVSSSARAGLWGSDDDGAINTEANRQQYTDQFITIPARGGTERGIADFVSFDADGFTVNWSDAINADIYYICLKGDQYNAGSVTTQTSTGNFSETGVGFQPSAGIFMSFCNAASGSAVTDIELSTGFATSSSDRFVVGAVVEDNVATSNADGYQDDALVYQNYDTSQTVEGAADFVSWDADGFTLNQTDADPTAGNELLYFVMGSDAAAGNPWNAYAQQ